MATSKSKPSPKRKPRLRRFAFVQDHPPHRKKAYRSTLNPWKEPSIREANAGVSRSSIGKPDSECQADSESTTFIGPPRSCPSHLSEPVAESHLGSGAPAEGIEHLEAAMDTFRVVAGKGHWGFIPPEKYQACLAKVTLDQLKPKRTEKGVEKEAWYRAMFHAVVAHARSWASDEGNAYRLSNPWKMPKRLVSDPTGAMDFLGRMEDYNQCQRGIFFKQRPLASCRTRKEANEPPYGAPVRKPVTVERWAKELAQRKKDDERKEKAYQDGLLPTAWHAGIQLGLKDLAAREEQKVEQAKQRAAEHATAEAEGTGHQPE
jgi:hypothetical protein